MSNNKQPMKNLFFSLQYELLKAGYYSGKTEAMSQISGDLWEVPTKFHSSFIQVGEVDLSPTVMLNGEAYEDFRYAPLNGLIQLTGAIPEEIESISLTFYKPRFTVIDAYYKYMVDTQFLRSIVPFFVVGFNTQNFNSFELGSGLTSETMSLNIELVASYGDEIEEMKQILGNLLASTGVREIDLTEEPLIPDPTLGYAFINPNFTYQVIGGWDVSRVPIRNLSFGYGDLNAYRAVTEVFLS